MPIGFHPMELILLVVIALLFFGPKRLVEMGSAVGKTVREFQNALHEDKESSSNAPSPDASTTLPPAKEHLADPQQITAPSVSMSSTSPKVTTFAAAPGTATTEPHHEEREEHMLPG